MNKLLVIIILLLSTHSITTRSNISPFVVTTSQNGETSLGSTVVLSDVTYHSDSDVIPPWSDVPTAEMVAISVIGTDLWLESKHLSTGTGPFFSFGRTEQESSLAAVGPSLRMETSLLQANLKNVTSASGISPNKQLFGSEIAQRVVGCSVSHCTNHDSGTGMMSPNLGGNVMCLNTSFSSCIRERNKVEDFQNKNYTQGSRLNNVPSDVTSVTFTLCTFNEITAATSESGGGSAILLDQTSSSLTVDTCFFHKCTCTGDGNDGGVIFVECAYSKYRPVSISASSFAECYTFSYLTDISCGGSISVKYTTTLSIDSCFFENSTANYDGALYIVCNVLTISNCAFVECSSNNRGGAISIFSVKTLSLSFLQFRKCSSTNCPKAKDIFFSNSSTQIISGMFTSCDTTSSTPNVFFEEGSQSSSTLVPRISSIPTIKSVEVSFDDSEATVTVVTEEAIEGTMGVLLDGSNVPRLVHVVFGDPSKVSSFATNLFPPPTVHSADSTLKDWNLTEIVVGGISLKKGSYSMLVEKGEKRVNITLTRSDSTTLTGTAPLHPSTAERRLEWSTEYKVTKVLVLPDGEQTEETVILTGTVTFITPDAPIRITSADCSLGGERNKSALVTLTGVKLGGGKSFNVTVEKMEVTTRNDNGIVLSGTLASDSSSPTHTDYVVIFGNTNSPLSFKTKYLITEFKVDGEVSVVDANVNFTVPAEPARLTSLESLLQYSSDEKNATISLSGIGMEGDYNVTLSVNSSSTNNVTLTASFDATGRGTVSAVLFDLSDPPVVDLSYNTRYEVVDVTQESNSVFFEDELVFTTIAVPPRLLSISQDDSAKGLNFVKLSFDSIVLPIKSLFELTLESKVIVLETDESGQLSPHEAQLYPFETEAEKKKGQLEYNTKYKVVNLSKGSTSIHFEDSTTRIQTPKEPARIVCYKQSHLNNDRSKMIVLLEGRALLSRTGKVSLTNGSSTWESLLDVVVVDNTHCTADFAVGEIENSTHMKYGVEYTLKGSWTESSGFLVEDGIKIVVPFPPRITSIEPPAEVSASTFDLSVSGEYLPFGSTFTVTLTSGHTFELLFSSSNAGTATILIGRNDEVKYNTEYTIKSIIRKEDGKDDEYILFASTTFRTPLGPTLSLISSPFHSSNPNFLNMSLSTERMPLEDFTLTLKTTESSPETISLTIDSSNLSAGFVVVEVYKKTDTLKYGAEYSIVGMNSSSVVAVVTALPFSTPAEPIRITSAHSSLGGIQQKSALVTLTGVKLGGGKSFNVTVEKMEVTTRNDNGIVLSGTLASDSSSPTHTDYVVIFGNTNSPLSFKTKYLITEFKVDGEVSVVDANVNFTVPAEPARLTSLESLLQYSSDEKNATISLSGIGMEGDYNVTLSVNSSSTNNVTLTASFDATGRGTVSAVLFDLSDPPVVDLSYNTRYEVVDVTQESDSIFFEDELVFTTIAVPPRLLSIKMSEYTVGMDFVELFFGSVALVSDATFTLTLESVHSDGTTPHQKVIILETDESGQLSPHEAQLYPFETEAEKKKRQLEFETEYKVLSLSKGSTPIHFEDIPTRIQTPMEPPRIEKCTARTLNSSRTELTVSLEGRKLRANLGFLNFSAGSDSWTSIGEIETDDETHCSVRFLTAGEEDPTHIEFGKEYILKTVSVDESNFIVNDGIIVRVPFPPKVTKMEFSSSNNLNTGCYVKLTGTDLIVGYSLKITLNDSLFVIATIISETEARSSELPIGWPTTLRHNTEYTLTSMEAMNEGDGKTIFDSPIANTTGSPLDPFVIYVDSGSTSDSTLFCGDKVRPCRSIEDGWKIAEGIQIWSFSVSIVHNTTQKEQVQIQSHHDILIESGPSTKPELFVSPSSSSSELEGEGMIEVVGGRLWLRDVDVVLTNSPSLIFIRMVGGHLTMETSSLTSTSTPMLNSDDVLCWWSGGAIVLEHATTTITSSTFSELSYGAINMKGGNLTIEGGIFHDNNPHFSSFPSLRHNIHCSGEGLLKIGSLSGGDGKADRPHLWLSNEDCTLSGEDVNANAPFFIPTLSSSSTSLLNKTEHAFSLTMEGSTLIPCSLFLEVFEKKKDGSEGQAKQFPLTQESASHFNDTTIVMSLPVSSLSGLDKGLEWRGRLVYGLKKTTASFVIQKNSVDRAAQAMRENMKWWIPVLVSLVCLLLLIVMVVLICWRRRQQKKGDDTQELTAHEELAPMDAEKMDIVDNDPSLGAVRNNSAEGNEVHVISEVGTNTKTFLNSGTAPNAHLCVEAIHCGGAFDTTTVRKVDTLYNILHRQDTRVEFSNRRLQRDLVEALKQLSAKEPMSELLTKLNPHNVMVSKEGRVSLKVKEDEAKTDGQILTEQSGFRPGVSGRTGNEQAGMRWEAPEVAKARETNAEGGKGESRKEVNRIQASIFSLGLVLWEIETRCVPFGEMDAVNAARQLETGVHPNMLWVMNATLREALISCLSLNPSDRPSCDQILSVLDGLTGPPKINLEARQQPVSAQNDPFMA
ncbi:hypothetical protein BLNAU_14782 [Blattamonas nauphoetae]|uniref:Protein kinase domain-containing protein n=1 Tax=Blattamonas nauphoetae TaxID=2049346 RepID=A0ABQ9XJF1_9EUKA|nr:hypothetical protein BLNAU_14782 [Blattamonas nauphoetae]